MLSLLCITIYTLTCSPVQSSPVQSSPDWVVVAGTKRTIQQRSSACLFCGRPFSAVLAKVRIYIYICIGCLYYEGIIVIYDPPSSEQGTVSESECRLYTHICCHSTEISQCMKCKEGIRTRTGRKNNWSWSYTSITSLNENV